jgi:hypothetical protein
MLLAGAATAGLGEVSGSGVSIWNYYLKKFKPAQAQKKMEFR